jgi:CRISPR-associated endonuclease/helicase Cas3
LRYPQYIKPLNNASDALPFESCLAKSRLSKECTPIAGRTVLDHCCIVGAVAQTLIDRCPKFLQENLFPDGTDLIAAVHDIGKVSPTFQKKIHQAIANDDEAIPAQIASIDASIERNWGGHAGISQIELEEMGTGGLIPRIAGSHHGYPPNLGARSGNAEQFGGQQWQEQRRLLLNAIKTCMHEDFPDITNQLQARVIAGLTCVADWIGSGYLFDDPGTPWKSIIPEAVDAAGFVQPTLIKELSFRDIFGFEARSAQQMLIEQASEPGVYVLEAPMGIGKTEAALYAAYSVLASGKATGIYFALPTQLTSNRIHSRVGQFLQKILASDSLHRSPLLLHGNAWLKEFELGEEGLPGRSWFNAAKRGILAPFAVGTVDQALMAAMNVKHGFVRTFGLAGKVVILDEVHSYDAYTGTILDRLVNELKQLHCTVIILSATLTDERRHRLMGTLPIPAKGLSPYPLITALPSSDTVPRESAPEHLAGNTVTVRSLEDIDEAFEEALARSEQGQQVLWIENTVADAQKAYAILSARTGGTDIACGLLHSRFIQSDRDALEEYWVSLYGADGSANRKERGRILIGTQVLEQSLDIDADFLVTRICPTDMLLQRIGRLWRHNFHQRPAEAVCEAWILSAAYGSAEKDPLKAFGMTAKVYSPYVLLRTLQTWAAINALSLPGDIRSLLESTYEEKVESPEMLRHKADLRQSRERLERFALQGVAMGIAAMPEERASTRHSELPAVSLLLIKSLHIDRETGSTATLLNGQSIVLPSHIPAAGKKRQRELAAILAAQTVRVTEYAAPAEIDIKNLSWLQPYFYLGDKLHDESILRVAIVGDDGMLTSLNGGPASPTHTLSYHPRLGYQSIKSIKKP